MTDALDETIRMVAQESRDGGRKMGVLDGLLLAMEELRKRDMHDAAMVLHVLCKARCDALEAELKARKVANV